MDFSLKASWCYFIQPMDNTVTKIRPTFVNGMACIAAFLAVMGLLAVLSFHFPQYLTTPRLREIYSEEQMRTLLFSGLTLGSLLAIVGVVFSQMKRLSLLALATLVAAWLAGGANVPLDGPVRSPAFYISLDWLLLDLLLIATLFINVELFFRLKKDQVILRRDWQVDLAHYVANHMFNGLLVVALFIPAQSFEKLLNLQQVQTFFSSLYLPLQVLLIMFLTDLAQYWVHRAFHQVPLLWRFHRIHHSVEVMDWLAGSRLHILDVLVTRSISLVPMVVQKPSLGGIYYYSMAIVIMGGLVVSTFLTTLLLPTTAALSEDIFAAIGRGFKWFWRRLEIPSLEQTGGSCEENAGASSCRGMI